MSIILCCQIFQQQQGYIYRCGRIPRSNHIIIHYDRLVHHFYTKTLQCFSSNYTVVNSSFLPLQHATLTYGQSPTQIEAITLPSALKSLIRSKN